jgi:protein gp37
MGDKSAIEWTDATWNPVTGCTKISPGCKFCYAERLAHRLERMGNPRYVNGFELTLHPDQVDLPLRWKRPRRVFVNSMSDLFHVDVPDAFIESVFQTMARAHWHSFQVLTKRADRLPKLAAKLPWPENVWMGVSVESRKYVSRIDHLRKVPAAVRFLSLEPLLGPLPALDLGGIDWVIVGGESGPGHRKPDAAWIRDLRDQCVQAHVPFFFKQWGGLLSKSGGRILDDETWDQMPIPPSLEPSRRAS